MTVEPTDISAAAHAKRPREVSGRYVVLAMFAFGVLSTAGIWVYWKLHLAPFMPLQKALVEAYPGSSPRVDGGRHKSTEPATLRLVLKVDFTPDEHDPRVPAMIDRTIAITRHYLDFREYEDLEIYLVHYPPEKSPRQYEYKRKIKDLLRDPPR